MSTAKYYSAAAEKEYKGYIEAPETFPVSFCYGEKAYKGFPESVFGKPEVSVCTDGVREMTTFVYTLDVLKITVEASIFKDYGVYDWRVWFENTSDKNSDIISNVLAADMVFEGSEPILNGVLGDHDNDHAPYEYDLTKDEVHFENTIGRATHITFPYFTFLTKEDSATIAIGWGGTWKADFTYNGSVSFKGTGTASLAAYLKPSEKIRTALITIARFKGHDIDFSVNQWRRWYFDCWCPKENGVHIQPLTTSCLYSDTGRPNSDGSISEGFDTWLPSLSKIYSENIRLDYRWIDAGWYCDADGEDIGQDWFGTVGTWEVDPRKWPDDALLQSVKYASEHGSRTLMWFEPERVSKVKSLAENYGYNPDWALGYDKDSDKYANEANGIKHGMSFVFALNNLGDPDCLKWTLSRILDTMDKHGIHMYREDFNCEPAPFWIIGDEKQGEGRTGITENLYMQGHYALWDGIIADCAAKGKTTFVDICASGGGRNDMESMHRGVPLLRSDADRTTVALRLSFTHSLAKWLPFTGCAAKESAGALEVGIFDEYAWRASFMGVLNYCFEYSHDPSINFGEIRRCIEEWAGVTKYLCKDFYPHTPWHTAADDTNWTVFSYYDTDGGEGVIQAFRQAECPNAEYTVKLQYADAAKAYDLCDVDKGNSFKGISGKELLEGITLKLGAPRTSAIIYIKEA